MPPHATPLPLNNLSNAAVVAESGLQFYQSVPPGSAVAGTMVVQPVPVASKPRPKSNNVMYAVLALINELDVPDLENVVATCQRRIEEKSGEVERHF